jgi:hypothetical protein
LGWSFRQRAREFNLAREIVQNGGSFNGNEEEGKKEKALTARETQSRIVRIFTGLSGEAPPERLFQFSGQTGLRSKSNKTG